MPRVRRYVEQDVLTAARERIRHVYDIFDSPVVTFSGGKDSSCVLLLAKEVHEERGLGPVPAIFMDEEFLPTENLAMIRELMQEPWIDLHWQCFPVTGERLILNEYKTFLRWDPERKGGRTIPEWAETLDDLGLPPGVVGIDYDQDEINSSYFEGSVAFMNGVRASESLVRYRSVVNKLNENYICKIEGKPNARYRSVKPIYDWEEMDVLKYIHDNDFPFCSFYDAQEMSGSTLRIGPPLGMAAKKVDTLAAQDPELWADILEVFPDTDVMARYWKDFDIEKAMEPYSDGFKGVMRYIQDNIPKGPYRDKAVKRYRMYKAMHDQRPDEFPPSELLKKTMLGAREKKVRGIDPNSAANRRKTHE